MYWLKLLEATLGMVTSLTKCWWEQRKHFGFAALVRLLLYNPLNEMKMKLH